MLSLLQVLPCGAVSPVTMTLAALREESKVGVRELLQVERPLSSSTQPRVLPRPCSTPFHLGSARGVLFPGRLLLFVHPNLSSIPAEDVAAQLAEHLQRVDPVSSGSPFEYRALEGLLWLMAGRQEKRVAYVARVLSATLHSSHASKNQDSDADSPLLTLLPLSNTLSHYENVSRGLMQCVRHLLDSTDLHYLCRGEEQQDQLEELLEAVHHSAAGTTLAAAEMTRQLGIKRDLLQLHQRAFQNSLLTFNLRLTQACLGLSGAMWCTSLFGQNLQSGLEGLGPGAFLFASGASMLVGTALFLGAKNTLSMGAGGGGRYGGSAASNPRRLESLQTFLLQLDVRFDAARTTLRAATQELARSGAKRLSKEHFCELHCQQSASATPAEAELLFDVLDSGKYEGSLSLQDLRDLESLLSDSTLHTIRAGVSAGKVGKEA